LKIAGQAFDKKKIAQALAAELKRLKIHGMNMEGTARKRFLFMLDPAGVKGMPAGLTKQAQAQWIGQAVKTPQQIEDLNLIKWRATVEGTGRAGLPFAFGVLGALTQYAALTSLREEEAKAMQHNKSESLRRIYAQGAQVAGAVSDLLGQGVSRLATRVPFFAQGMTGALSKLLIGVGRRLGIAGSLVMAGFDVWRGFQELDEGNETAGYAYIAAGGLGIAATVLLAVGWTGWGLIVVAALIVWSFIMPMLIDNKIQDWLERVHEWGNLTDKRYQDFATEQSELKKALAN
jgi:hypothetical protein